MCIHYYLTFSQLESRETEVREARQASQVHQERMTKSEEEWEVSKIQIQEQMETLEKRVESLTQHNDMLHGEAEKVWM